MNSWQPSATLQGRWPISLPWIDLILSSMKIRYNHTGKEYKLIWSPFIPLFISSQHQPATYSSSTFSSLPFLGSFIIISGSLIKFSFSDFVKWDQTVFFRRKPRMRSGGEKKQLVGFFRRGVVVPSLRQLPTPHNSNNFLQAGIDKSQW